MHKFFQIGRLDYEQRKVETVNISKKCLYTHSILVEQFETYNRKHDIADALCMTLFWIDKKQKEYENNMKKEEAMERKIIVYDRQANGYKLSVNEWFEQFRY